MQTMLLVVLFLLAEYILTPNLAQAVPANPLPATLTQPDNTTIELQLKGDEYFHWLQDLDGFTVIRTQNKEYVYARLNTDNELVPTAFAVGSVNPSNAGLKKHALPAKQLLRQLRSSKQPPSASAPSTTAQSAGLVQTSGNMNNLVILVNFSDKIVDYNISDFNDLFNQIGYAADGAAGSVKDFFNEASYNNLNVQSTVVEAVTLDNGYAYYGENDFFEEDKRPREMVEEALAKLQARGFDFSTMDANSDGVVDSLTIIHAGGGEEYSGNDPDYIWSHQWSITSPVYYDNVQLDEYHTVPARRGFDDRSSTWGITRIGVICHEMGHILGLPDLYDYDYDSEGAGDFCLMAGGSWNGSHGSSPAHPSAWCKADLNWLTPTLVTHDNYYTIPAVENDPNVYKLQGNFPANEYFLIENRQPIGFDTKLPGSQMGILIWHVDENQPDNDDQAHYKVDLEEASPTQHLELDSNSGDDADYFRAGNAVTFTDTSTPNNRSYSGASLGIDITDIGPTAQTMQFTVGQPKVVNSFEFSPIETQIVNVPFEVVITAKDISNMTVTDFNSTVDLSAAGTNLSDPNEIQIGTGTSTSQYPISVLYEKRRTQTIYLAAEIDQAGTITDLALYVTEIPARNRNNWTIRMKHTTLTYFQNVNWHDTGWTVVYQNDKSPNSPGWQYYHLTTPFEYNNSDSLMVDFSFDNTAWDTPGGYSNITSTSNHRTVAFKTDSAAYGSPTTWSGTSPRASKEKWIPNIQLKIGEPSQQIIISPTTTGNFIDGVWTGDVTVFEKINNIILTADDSKNHNGDSNAFDVSDCNTPSLNNIAPLPGAVDVPITALLSWTDSSTSCAAAYDVYFGTTNPPATLLCNDANDTSCDPNLNCSTLYYWQVSAENCCDTVTGPVWSFTTESLPADFDSNCTVNHNDLMDLAQSWLTSDPNLDIAPPTPDGIINLKDFTTLSAHWLEKLSE